MPSFTYTYTLTNGQTADADEVTQNFNDVRNGVTDGTKDISVAAITAAGTTTLNGAVTLGNAAADDITVTGSLASSIPIKTTNTYNIGSSTLGLASVYFGTADTDTARVVSAELAASRTYTMPDAGANASFVMTAGAQTITGVKTLSNGISFGDATLNKNLVASGSITSTVTGITIDTANDDWIATRTGNTVTVKFKLKFDRTASISDNTPSFTFSGWDSDLNNTVDEVSVLFLATDTEDSPAFQVRPGFFNGGVLTLYYNTALATFPSTGTYTYNTGHVSLSNYYVQFTYTVQS